MDAPGFHTPVLVEEVMRHLLTKAGLYLDGTVGGGGHAQALMDRCPDCRLLAVDRDREALEAARTRLARHRERIEFARTSFGAMRLRARLDGEPLAGALLDLGVSSHQLDTGRRGFTYRRGAALDMRMDPDSALTAAAFLERASDGELRRVLGAGGAPRPAALAARLVRARVVRPLRTSDDLVAALDSVLARRSSHAEKARLFQALRMHVNDEVAELERGLPAIRDALGPGAALVVLSYHSVEDRIVKRAFRDWSDPSSALPRRLPVRAAELTAAGSVATRRPLAAGPAEVESNPRARSARLRAWRRAA